MSRLAYGKMSFSGGEPVLQDKSITSNGTYTADEGYDGIGTATVNVPNPSTGTVSITSNGTTDVTDYASASVNVQPTLQDKTITANGTYSADSGYDGLDEVTVNVPNPSSGSISISANGTYDVTEKASAVVNVPQPSGNINITTTAQTDVTNYATAQVVDADLVAGNIKKDVDILGVVGTYEGGSEPAKGFVPTAWDSDGYVTSGKIVGMTEIQAYFLHNQSTTNSIQTGRIVTLELPDTITSIGQNAFYRCSELMLTSLPSGITSINKSAFEDCYALALTSLPSGVTSIGNYAFSGCRGLALTSLPSGVTNISERAFWGCTNLPLPSLPNELTIIGNYAFYGCTNLALTSIPSGVTKVGISAFFSCSSLTSITFEGTPTSINSTTFTNCTNLTDIKVPWAEGAVANAPWGATNATITYNYTA